MKKRLLRITSLLMAACTLVSVFSMSALALSWDGSSAGGGGEGGAATTKGFSIRYTDDRNCLGYRFSVVDKAGGTRNGLSIDVYRNISNANSEFNTAYKYTVKYNKRQLIDNQNSGFSTSKNTDNCYKEADMGFASALPVPSGMETWQNNAGNLNAILAKLKIGSVSNLKNGDKILVEPLYNVRLQTIYHSVTTTELAIYGKWLLGANSDGGSSGNSDTWGFISAYTNRHYPNSLYTPDGQGLWTGVSALTKRATFYDIINKGYGVGIAYTRNSSLYPYRVADNSGSGSSLIPFDLTSQWTQDTAHTTETTRINIPVVKADVELTNIRLIGENGYYVTGSTLWAHQTVTPQYTYRNNTSVRVYIEAYNHDKSKKDGVYAIDPGESINVNGKAITVPQGDSFSVWGGVYLEGAGLGNTSWESNGSNNAWTKSWTVKHPLTIETIKPNAIYREGTQVISSFKVVNAYSTQFIPGSGISVKFTAKSGGRTLYTTTKTGVVVPGSNEQLVYFKWTVPSGLNGASVTVQGDVVDNGVTVDTAAQNVSTGKVVDSQTPDTDYEDSKPAGWSQASKPSPSSTQATWSEWVYVNGAFQKKTYGMKITQNTVTLTPDSGSPSAEMVNGVWQLKSGYGLTASYTPGFSAVSGTLMPSSSAYTAVQHGYMQFPEFRYSSANGQYRTLQKAGNSFQFAVNPAADGGRVHFIPVWYPDGSYQASCYVYDCWTPAGMIAARLDTNQLAISGSLYDDWYVGREG